MRFRIPTPKEPTYVLFALCMMALIGASVTSSDYMTWGDGTTGASKVLEADVGAGSANPTIRYNPSSTAWETSLDGAAYKAIGSGGSGEVNYLDDDSSRFEGSGAGGWETYDDGAVADPVDGTGGSPSTVTFAKTTTSSLILRDSGTGYLSHSAADGQGEGLSKTFNVDPGDAGKILKVEAPYVFDGSLGDLGLYVICDLDGSGTGPVIYGDDPYEVNAATDGTDTNLVAPKTARGGPDFLASFLAPDNSEDLDCRVVFHIKTTSATAWNLSIDDVVVGPGKIVQGAVTTEVTATEPGSGWAVDGPDNATYTVTAFRTGDRVKVSYTIQATGTSSAFSDLELRFPVGMTYDSPVTKTSSDRTSIGYGQLFKNGSLQAPIVAAIHSTTTDSFHLNRLATKTDDAGSAQDPLFNAAITNSSPTSWNTTPNPTMLVVEVEFPVAEWSGSGSTNYFIEDNLTEWKSFTLTGSWTTNANYVGYYRRKGDSADLDLRVNLTGTPNAATMSFDISGLGSVDVSKFSHGGFSVHGKCIASIDDSGTKNMPGGGTIASATDIQPRFFEDATAPASQKLSPITETTVAWATSDSIELRCNDIPMVGWGNQASPLVGFAEVTAEHGGLVPALDGTCTSARAKCVGTYTPTASNLSANLSTVTPSPAVFEKTGDRVCVDSDIQVTASSAVSNNFLMDLPIARTDGNFNQNYEAGGAANGNKGDAYRVIASTTGVEKVQIAGISPDTATNRVGYHFCYYLSNF